LVPADADRGLVGLGLVPAGFRVPAQTRGAGWPGPDSGGRIGARLERLDARGECADLRAQPLEIVDQPEILERVAHPVGGRRDLVDETLRPAGGGSGSTRGGGEGLLDRAAHGLRGVRVGGGGVLLLVFLSHGRAECSSMQRLVPGSLRHLQPHAEVAERVLVPGDPGRALRIAQWLLERPRMLNHHRGLWGYTGTAADGAPLTVQSAGMGGASTAIVVHELIALGARRLVRVGTCEALASGVALGDLLVVREAVARDGTSRGLDAPSGCAPTRR
jgi:hypothetical protein